MAAGRILRNVRDFVFSVVNKEFLIFLFFLALSGVFWLMMTLNGTYEKELQVEMRLVGVPENTIITAPLPDSVKITVRDKGFVLLSYGFSHKIRSLSFPFATFANHSTGKGQVPVSEINKAVKQQLFGSTTLISLKCDHTAFLFNDGEQKTIPVRLAGTLTPKASYYIAKVNVVPDKVTIYSDKHTLDSLKAMPTETFKITNIQDTLVTEVSMSSIYGVKCVPNKVKLEIFTDILTEESIEVPITTINVPEGIVLRTFPQRVRVIFYAGARMVRDIKSAPEEFVVVADYQALADGKSDKCSLQLQSAPRTINNARIETPTVDYLVEQQ